MLTIIGAPDWHRLAALLSAAPRDPQLARWYAYRATTADRIEEMLLLPARHDPLARGSA